MSKSANLLVAGIVSATCARSVEKMQGDKCPTLLTYLSERETMTRKDYEKIAGAFNETLKVDKEYEGIYSPAAVIALLAEKVADIMQAENPRFHRATFLKACGTI